MLNLLVRAVGGLIGGGDEGEGQPQYEVDKQLFHSSINTSINTLKEFQRLQNEDLIKILRQEAGWAAAKFAEATPPLNGKGITEAKRDIDVDVNYIFKPLESIPFGDLVMAKQWPAVTAYNFNFKNPSLAKAYADGKYEYLFNAFSRSGKNEARQGDVIVVNAPNHVLHKSARTKTGQLNGKQFFVKGKMSDARAKIAAYADKAKELVGLMAAGWVKCYKQLKGTGYTFPSGLEGKGKGGTKTQWWGKDKFVEIRNDLGNFGGYINQNSTKFQGALDTAAVNINTRVKASTNALTKRLKMD